jgi:cytochrome b6-f complex iron-sulfur subunit
MTATISSGVIAAIVAFVALDIFTIAYGLSFLRARKAAAAQAGTGRGTGDEATAAAKPVSAVSRRDFFRGSLLVSLAMFGAEFGLATLAFLWPNLKGGFGSVVTVGALNDIKAQIQSTQQPFYYGAGRLYIVLYSGTATSDADYAAAGVAAEGVMPLYQKCAHLGCRVPFCASSKWFECPCHGSKYNGAGEYQLGPAPRGMDRFKIVMNAGNITVDTSAVVLGPPRGTNTISQPPQGSFCVAPG